MVHKQLRVHAFALVILLGAVVAVMADPPSGDDATAQAAPQPDVRHELLSEFAFMPSPPPVPETSVILRAGVAAPDPVAGTLVVNMEPYTVRENLKMDALHSELLQQRSKAVTATEMRRLGVGIHPVAVGPVHLFAGTIFYVPFVVGGGFAW